MTNQQILEKAIQKAIDGGWVDKPMTDGKWEILPDLTFKIEKPLTDVTRRDYLYLSHNDIIFDHDFAKSLFGTEMQNGQPRWRNALQYIVVQEDPIEALGRLLEL